MFFLHCAYIVRSKYVELVVCSLQINFSFGHFLYYKSGVQEKEQKMSLNPKDEINIYLFIFKIQAVGKGWVFKRKNARMGELELLYSCNLQHFLII